MSDTQAFPPALGKAPLLRHADTQPSPALPAEPKHRGSQAAAAARLQLQTHHASLALHPAPSLAPRVTG